MLRAEGGATIDEIVAALDWQPHTARGAMSGALKKKLGLTITSDKDRWEREGVPHHRRLNRQAKKPIRGPKWASHGVIYARLTITGGFQSRGVS